LIGVGWTPEARCAGSLPQLRHHQRIASGGIKQY
jgi:hypothetical protein